MESINKEAVEIVRLFVEIYPRASLRLQEVFALDRAKAFLKEVDKYEALSTMPRPTCGDGHRVSGFSSPVGNQGDLC